MLFESICLNATTLDISHFNEMVKILRTVAFIKIDVYFKYIVLVNKQKAINH